MGWDRGPTVRKILLGLVAAALLLPTATVPAADASNPTTPALRAGFDPGSKIKHVVVILKENHSFNSVLGPFCARNNRCRGDDIGTLEPTSTGQVALSRSPDVVPVTDHSGAAQRHAWNDGANDHWNLIGGCGAPEYA
ncbi:MAG TPA: alkaline phosphatase family protein, partial [Actinomycetes bacterium]|nr:alkaline phosphatase family protein [Actinomycetes bacterium]